MTEYYYKDSKRKGRKRKLILLILLLLLIPLTLSFFKPTAKSEPDPIKEAIEEIISPIHAIAQENLDGDYAVVIKNLKTGETYSYNEDKKFDSASLYKLWVMAVTYQKLNDGTLKETEVLSAELEKLNITLEITPTATPSAAPTEEKKEEEEKEKERVSMSVSTALDRMITISNNYAAILLASRSGNLTIANFVKNQGFTNSNFRQPPQTTAKDTALFFEKLYKGQLTDSEEMMELLKRQTLNDRIPKYLPENVEVAHKTGELGGSKHDAGIVFSKKGDYIIVVLTESDNPSVASQNIANFSKEIFDYFENL